MQNKCFACIGLPSRKRRQVRFREGLVMRTTFRVLRETQKRLMQAILRQALQVLPAAGVAWPCELIFEGIERLFCL